MFFERSYHRWDMESKLVIAWRRQGLFDLLLVRQWYQSQSWTISLFIPMDPRWPTAGNRSWQTGLCRIQPRGWIRWTTEVVAHSQSFRWFGNWRDWHVRLVCGYSIDVIALQSMTDSERDASVDSWRTRCTSIGVLLTSLFFLVATFLSCECIASKSSSKCIRWNLKANHGFITVSSSVMFHRSADLFFPTEIQITPRYCSWFAPGRCFSGFPCWGDTCAASRWSISGWQWWLSELCGLLTHVDR